MNAHLRLEIEVLKEISAILVNERHVKVLLEQVLAVLHRRMGMLRGTIALLHGEELSIEVSHGLGEGEKQRGRYHLGEGITGHVAQTGVAQIIPDISQDKRFLNRTGTREKAHNIAFICVPIKRAGKLIGTLSIDRQQSDASELGNDKQLLEIVGNMTADAAFTCHREFEEKEFLREENRQLRSLLHGNPGDLVGTSKAMRHVFELIHQVAPSDATVLIRGSSGTGKEVVACALVELSKRSKAPFIAVNCAALPEGLIESELFGHEKGAFTGAIGRRVGRVEAAEGGTLFLDEIGDLTPMTQVKLLRLIQERTYSRVGSNQELRANVRFLAATSRPLEELMRQQLFREDLYYRLNIFPIVMPDLQRRQSDIILLAEHFMVKYNACYEKNVGRLSPSVIERLLAYAWPGNVRELENCLERAILTTSGETIHLCNLPPSLQSMDVFATEPVIRGALPHKLAVYERELIAQALENQSGNLSAAARELGISPRVMHYKVHKLGLV